MAPEEGLPNRLQKNWAESSLMPSGQTNWFEISSCGHEAVRKPVWFSILKVHWSEDGGGDGGTNCEETVASVEAQNNEKESEKKRNKTKQQEKIFILFDGVVLFLFLSIYFFC